MKEKSYIRGNKGITNMTLIVIVLVIFILLLAGFSAYLIINPKTVYVTQNTPTEQENQTIGNIQTEQTVSNSSVIKTEKEDNKLNNNILSNENIYEKIKGTYEYSTESYPGYEDIYIGNRLFLKEDGTFVYVITKDNPEGYCGNYIINNSEIILNKLFGFGSDVGLTVVEGNIKLELKDDGTIFDANKYIQTPLSNVVLTKKSTEINETFMEYINASIKYDAFFNENIVQD